MKIKITADSTCDLSEELLKKWDIALMPMHILMGEDSYLDGVTVHPADVFAYVNQGGKMPKSAAANLVEYTEFFAPFAKEYDAVIHISVSSKLSSCFQNARLAAGEFENVCVVDSQNICTGQGYLVLKAAKWAADGLTARAIQMKLQSLAKRVELSFVLDRLDFMAKSGRCSGVLAFGANLLGIKPALEVINGELKVVKKYRGSLPICVRLPGYLDPVIYHSQHAGNNADIFSFRLQNRALLNVEFKHGFVIFRIQPIAFFSFISAFLQRLLKGGCAVQHRYGTDHILITEIFPDLFRQIIVTYDSGAHHSRRIQGTFLIGPYHGRYVVFVRYLFFCNRLDDFHGADNT